MALERTRQLFFKFSKTLLNLPRKSGGGTGKGVHGVAEKRKMDQIGVVRDRTHNKKKVRRIGASGREKVGGGGDVARRKREPWDF